MTGVRGSTRWTVDTGLTSATFSVRNLGVRTVTGTVPVTSGRVEVDADGRPVVIEAELDLAGIDTRNTRRDHDLRVPRLLDLDTHPRATFRGGPAVAAGDGGWTVPGVLRVKGRDVDVQLVVAADEDAGTAVATTTFDRAAFGIRAPRVMIGRRITVRIYAVLRTV